MRPIAIIVLLLLSAILISGCTFSIGRQDFMLRPGFRVPPRSVEKGDGEQVILEGMDPEGNAMFVFIRGRL